MSKRVHPAEHAERDDRHRNVTFAEAKGSSYEEEKGLIRNGAESEPELPVDRPDGDAKWTPSHARLLYLISSYAVAASTAEDEETWIRSVPLTVLMYEGVVAGALDFDYAPASVLVSQDGKSRRLWMNITQEGRSAIDDLREKEFINGLKLSSEDFQPVTAYQQREKVTRKGMEYVKRMPKYLRREVDDFTYAPAPHPRVLLQVSFDGEAFVLHGGEYSRNSDVTDIEDVSYVASPYLPRCLRAMEGKPLSSNAHRAHESASGKSNIRDQLSEAINLGHINILVGEWVPFGSNQIVALNERLGSLDRCQGGMFTSVVDKTPTETKFSVPTGLTSVRIIDFDLVHYINFEAEINYPEEEGIVQVENFGMHLNVDGSVVYGMIVEAITERKKESLSLDLLSRLLVDVHQDSSKIMDDLLSEYQRSLLNMLFTGDSLNRGKFNIIIADAIEPRLPAEEYLDRGDYENELKQVLGDIWEAHSIGKEDVLIIGREGLLLAGPSSKRHEKLLLQYCSILFREMFIRNFFTRTFILDDSLKKIRSLIQQYEKDPNNISKIRDMLNAASRDIILLKEVLSYLEESLETMSPPEIPKDEAGTLLFEVLNIEQLKADVDLRVRDLTKLIDGAQHEMMNLSQVTEVINTKQLEDVFKNVEANTKYLVDASAANERASNSLEVMQIILAGSFAFDILDRLTGGTLNMPPPEWVSKGIIGQIIDIPMLWFSLNMVWLFLMCYLLLRLMRWLGRRASGVLTLRIRVNKRINIDRLNDYLSKKEMETIDTSSESRQRTKKCTWIEPATKPNREKWAGPPPKIEVFYDEKHGFLLTVVFIVDKKKCALSEEGLLAVFLQDLYDADVLLSKGTK